ncbi:MAG: alpha/beta fold hydrolase BchO [Pseudomonadota bacterium]
MSSAVQFSADVRLSPRAAGDHPAALGTFSKTASSNGGLRQVSAGGIRWRMRADDAHSEARPRLLLLHGTGAGIHSWNGIWPLLAEDFQLLAPDLPGHGGTHAPDRWRPSLPAMADGLAALLETEGFEPDLVVGHSAGAALAARLTLDAQIAPRALVAINGAFMPYGGAAAGLMMPIARWCAESGVLTRQLARRASQAGAVERLLEQTGSAVTEEAAERYRDQLQRPEHVSGTLRMMAYWDLRPLLRDLRGLPRPLYLLVGDRDMTVPPRQAEQLGRRIALAATHHLPGLGHLAHEEQPASVAALLNHIAADHGLINRSEGSS